MLLHSLSKVVMFLVSIIYLSEPKLFQYIAYQLSSSSREIKLTSLVLILSLAFDFVNNLEPFASVMSALNNYI